MSQPIVEGYRLSPAQQRLWRQHGASIGPHRVRARVSIAGSVDPARLDAARLDGALRTMGVRHEILGTTYRRVAGMSEPVQVAADPTPGAIVHEDLRGIDPAVHAAIVDARWRALADVAIDVERGPVWMARLLTHSSREATLLLTWPAITADAASVGIFVRQLVCLLDAGPPADEADDETDVSEPAWQHVELSEWQHQILDADSTAASRQFWWEIPPETIANCRLPLRRRASYEEAQREQTLSPRTIASPLPPEIADGLARWAAARDRSIEDVLLACWHVLAWRLTGQRDLCLGIASHGRNLDELTAVLGPLTKTLPVCVSVDPQWSFAECVERVGASWQDHRRRHEFLAWNLREPHARLEDMSWCPLLFDLLDEPPVVSSDGLRFTIIRVASCLDRFELKLSIVRADDRWQAHWDYDPLVHDAAQVAQIAAAYIGVLRQAAADTLPPIAAFDVRGEAERASTDAARTAFARASAEDERDTGDVSVPALFAAHVRATPARVAVISGHRRVTYAELGERTAQIARFLRAAGAGPDTRVGLMLDRSIDLVASAIGVLEAGAAFVPLPPEQPATRLRELADRADARIVLTQGRLADAWPAGSPHRLVCLDRDSLDAVWAGADSLDADPLDAVPTALDHLAYVMFTSGSTGEPKGVMIAHRALASYVRWCRDAYLADAAGAATGVPLHSSIGFDATLTSLLAPLCAGALVAIVPEGDPLSTIRALTSSPDRFAFIKATPAHLALIAGETPPERLSALTGTLVIGGEALTAEQLASWRHHAPETRIVNEYGPTEATVGCLTYEAAAGALEPGPVPIGCALPRVECCVVDAYGCEAAVGVTGELLVGGPQLARGYDGRPDLTAERFVPAMASAVPGARWYRTGDLVRPRADGSLEYVGRRDRQVKLRGYRIELGEVEAACRRLPGVREAAVLLREDVPGERRLAAYLVPDPDRTLTTDRVQQALRSILPDYMVPAAVVLLDDDLPLTRHGKMDHARLPAVGSQRPALTESYVAPRTPTEATLATIWAEILRHDRVGVHDNFFALGGDSILSLQIVARAARAGVRLAPRLVFEHQTIAELAAMADRRTDAGHDQSPVTGSVPLLPIQHWFFERGMRDEPHYNHAIALDLIQPIAAEQLAAIWLDLQGHHDALRLRYRYSGAEWLQYHAEMHERTPLVSIDVSSVPPPDRDAIWDRVAHTVNASLDPVCGPLARAVVMQPADAPAAARLLLVVHHLVIDGVSWRILLDDLHELCAQAHAQPRLLVPAVDQRRLPEKTLSFKSWSERFTAFVERGGFDAQLALWTEMSRPGARLPRDVSSSAPDDARSDNVLSDDASANDVRSSRTWHCALNEDDTKLLTQRAPAALGVHVQDVLLAAVAHALAQTTGEGAWRIDLEGHGRGPFESREVRDTHEAQDDVSRTVGWFTSLYPVHLDLPSLDDPVMALRAARGVLRRIPGSGEGYGALRYLRSGAAVEPLRGAPMPEIVFNYWGHIGQGIADSGILRPSRATRGPLRAAAQAREYLLEISASVAGDRLQMHWTYSVNVHRLATVKRLAGRVLDAIRALAALPATMRASLQTPADFPLAALTQREVDEIAAAHGPIAGIYPLSPTQEGLLFHWLHDADRTLYSQQFCVRLAGPIEPAAFREAWEAVVARYDVLRTGFSWARRDRPLQIVAEQAALPWIVEDWRTLPPAEQDRQLAAFTDADRRLGFALERPPLMRVSLFQLEDERWAFLWNSHHIVLDGWSMPIVVRDVMTTYAARLSGEAPALTPPPARYAEYIAWLQRQDLARAETYWRGALDGVRTPGLLAVAPPASGAAAPAAAAASMGDASPPQRTLRTMIAAPIVEALRRLGREQHVTLNTWLAGAWGVLLSHCLGRADVIFGAVVSGRPAELPGVELIPGLFVNTLPLRLTVQRDTPALAWFADLQRRQLDAREYEYVSVARIQNWTAIPAGARLFDTLFVYENYPVEDAWQGDGGLGPAGRTLRLQHAESVVPTNFPLTIEVADAGAALAVHVIFETASIGSALAAFIRDGFDAILSQLTAWPDDTLGALLDRLDAGAPRVDADQTRLVQHARQQSLQTLRRSRAGAGEQLAGV